MIPIVLAALAVPVVGVAAPAMWSGWGWPMHGSWMPGWMHGMGYMGYWYADDTTKAGVAEPEEHDWMCPHHGWWGAWWEESAHEESRWAATSLTGKVAAVDPYRLQLMVYAEGKAVTLRLPGVMVDADSGYIVSTRWLISTVNGKTVKLTVVDSMVVELKVDGKTYTAPMSAYALHAPTG